jgi:hypothetical protein
VAGSARFRAEALPPHLTEHCRVAGTAELPLLPQPGSAVDWTADSSPGKSSAGFEFDLSPGQAAADQCLRGHGKDIVDCLGAPSLLEQHPARCEARFGVSVRWFGLY